MISKKLLIVLGIFLLIGISIIIFFLLSSKKPQASEVTVPYTAPSFSVSYPDNWISDKREIAGGGTSFTARVNSATEYFPRLTIESTPTTGVSKEEKIKALSFYDFPRSEVQFRGHPATKLAGDLHLKFETGNPEQKPVYKVFLFVPTETTLYTISYAYFDDENRAASEAMIQQMLDSLEIH